jgi:hypothetical protein
MPVKRNTEIKSDKRTGRGARFTTFNNGWTVETYYNRSVVSFCTCVKDEKGHFVLAENGDDLYQYAGGVSWARSNHEDAIKFTLSCIEKGKADGKDCQ